MPPERLKNCKYCGRPTRPKRNPDDPYRPRKYCTRACYEAAKKEDARGGDPGRVVAKDCWSCGGRYLEHRDKPSKVPCCGDVTCRMAWWRHQGVILESRPVV